MRCTWCQIEEENLTNDHVIPRALGGTLEFSLIACNRCQTSLSKVEEEVARRSILAFHALTSPLRPRHPDRPTSGLLKSNYLLVKHPLGGYGESILRSGERMESLAHIEINVEPGTVPQARIRGPSPEAAQRLLSMLRLALASRPREDGLLCEFKVRCEVDPATAADPDFWPRIVLFPGDRLLIRARSPEECVRFARALTQLAVGSYQVDPSRWGLGIVVEGGTPHTLSLKFNPQTIRRVAAKIAYGFYVLLSACSLQREHDHQLRHYILGLGKSEDEPVLQSEWPENWVTSDKPHYVLISPQFDRDAAIVSLYGWHFRVDLGPGAALPSPIVVLCQTDGTNMHIAMEDEAEAYLAEASGTSFSEC